MVGIECCGNSLGLGTLMIFNLHFVCEVILVIIQVMMERNLKFDTFSIFYVHLIVCVCLASAFFGIFNDKPIFVLPQIVLQLCILVVAAVNVLSWIFLSHMRILVFTELRNVFSQQPNVQVDYFNLYVKIVLGSLFVGLYFYFLMVVVGFYRKLKKESRFSASSSKSSTITEEIIL